MAIKSVSQKFININLNKFSLLKKNQMLIEKIKLISMNFQDCTLKIN